MKDLSFLGFPGYEISTTGEVYSKKTNRYLKHKIDRDGYHCVGMLHISGKQRQQFVHRLVALAYIPNPDNLETVNHKNGNKDKNDLEELEWLSRAENTKHGMDTELIPKRTSSDVSFLDPALLSGKTIDEIQNEFSVARNCITRRRKELGITTNRGNVLPVELHASVVQAVQEGKTYAWIEQNLGVSRRCIAKIKKSL